VLTQFEHICLNAIVKDQDLSKKIVYNQECRKDILHRYFRIQVVDIFLVDESHESRPPLSFSSCCFDEGNMTPVSAVAKSTNEKRTFQ